MSGGGVDAGKECGHKRVTKLWTGLFHLSHPMLSRKQRNEMEWNGTNSSENLLFHGMRNSGDLCFVGHYLI